MKFLSSLGRLELGLQALDYRVEGIAHVQATVPSPAPPADPLAAPPTADKPVDKEESIKSFRAMNAKLASAPAAPQILQSALQSGTLTHDELNGFHLRLNEQPEEQQVALLKQLQSAMSDGKIQLGPKNL